MLTKILNLIRGVDEEYGLRLVTGTFGSGKTKNTFMEAFLRKQEHPEGILISNIPYKDINGNPLVDIQFSSKKDLTLILQHLFTYLDDTNYDAYLREQLFIPIRLIVDEAHLYYFSRDFKSFDLEMMTILTQCRKRKITMYFITQELAQIDKFLRRLCPEVIVYTRGSMGLSYKSLMYFKSTERSDISDNYNVEELSTKTIRWDALRLFFSKDLQAFFDQKYLTYYICGAQSLFTMTYKDFIDFINLRRDKILSDEKEKDEISPIQSSEKFIVRKLNESNEISEDIPMASPDLS